MRVKRALKCVVQLTAFQKHLSGMILCGNNTGYSQGDHKGKELHF